MHYRPEIDGLRALAVIPVIFYHAGFRLFSGGYVGVDVFFVISGYLITSIILSDKKAGKFSITNFYERRLRRILPALFLMIFVLSAAAWLLLLAGEFYDYSKTLIAVPVFFSNVLFYKEAGYFAFASELKPLLHTWSLAVEEQFYLLYPIFILGTWKLGTRFTIILLAVLTAVSLGLAEWASIYRPEAGFYLLPTRGWELSIGALTAFYLAYENPDRDEKKSQLLGFLGLLLIAIAIFGFDHNTRWPSLYTLVPVIGTALVILFASKHNSIGTFLSQRMLVTIGLISYSAYLWHHPLFAFSRITSPRDPNTLFLLLLVALTFVIAYLSWRFVENPFRKKNYYKRRHIFLLSGFTSITLIIIGVMGVKTNGFVNRFPQADRHLASINYGICGEYVQTHFNSLKLIEFDKSDKRHKVIVIGDSYAQDLVNAVYEADQNRNIQLSTYYIPANHGNLYLKEDLTYNSSIPSSNRLNEHLGYKDKELIRRMQDADMIWLASSWTDWEAKLAPASLENLESDFGPKVFIFGRKDFGSINLRNLISMSIEERQQYKNPIPTRYIEINELMAKTLPEEKFINVSSLLSADKTGCTLFTKENKLISHDGAHLTKEGARLYGEKLFENFSDVGISF